MAPTITREPPFYQFPSTKCFFCKNNSTSHYCVEPDDGGDEVFEHSDGDGLSSLRRRCGKAFCASCRENANYEGSTHCLFHDKDSTQRHTLHQRTSPRRNETTTTSTTTNTTTGASTSKATRNLGEDFVSPGGASTTSAKSTTSASRDITPPVPPTSRKSNKGTTRVRYSGVVGKDAQKGRKISVGIRVCVSRSSLFHIATPTQKPYLDAKLGNSHQYFGTVSARGQGKSAWKVKFDIFGGDIEVTLKRQNLSILRGTEESTLVDVNEEALEEEVMEVIGNGKKKGPSEVSQSEFIKKGEIFLKDVAHFVHEEGDTNRKFCIDWEILPVDKHIEEDTFEFPSPPQLNFGDRNLTDMNQLRDIFFDRIFPSVKGHGKLMDEYLADSRSSFHTTAKREKIRFHFEEADDPDWKIKLCYKLMISATLEKYTGLDNLWKKGKPVHSRHEYPDYGKFISKHEFQCFKAAAPFTFCDKKYWFLEKRDCPWDIFQSLLDQWNIKRSEFFIGDILAVMLDESMSGYCPKTSKTGGLPSISFEPRKPVPLGTLLRNAAECSSASLLYQDVQMRGELQDEKKYNCDASNMPDKAVIPSGAAEVLRQVDGCKLKAGSWVGGDAHFGSVCAAVECMKRCEGKEPVRSTFVIKQQTKWFPKKVLLAVLRSRHGTRSAGHWVVMRTEISGIKLFICGYAWSNSSVAYFVSTCGKTLPSPKKYMSNFEDDFGFAQTKELSRPSFLDFFFTYCPIIDEHNKQRQFLLRLEKCWKTQDPWFRLLTTLLSESVVDLYHLSLRDISDRKKRKLQYDNQFEPNVNDDEMDMFEKVRDFADALTSDIDSYKRQRRGEHQVDGDQGRFLERITDENGNKSRPATQKQMDVGRRSTVGSAFEGLCFICRCYEAGSKAVKTAFRCKECHMPLCQIDRGKRTRIGDKSCIQHHFDGIGAVWGCGEKKKYKEYKIPRGFCKWKYIPTA